MKRRSFLKNAACFSTGLITTFGYSRLVKANDRFVTAVIIGSGFGGAVAALRLGQAGIDTVVLERGRRWPITSAQNTFATQRQPDGRAAWLSTTTFEGAPVDKFTGVLETKSENGITVLCGAGVGGSSLSYFCATLQPTRDLFYKTFPRAINYEELDRVYFPRVRSILKPSKHPSDILNSSYYQSSRAFLEQIKNTGLPYFENDLNVNWDIVRQEIAGTREPSLIIGDLFFGSNSGAKNSLDRNYLAQAEQSGFVEILPLHVAKDISEVGGEGYRVYYEQITETGEVVVSGSITCRYLFLAAGSMGTSALLVKAKEKGTLPRLNEQIGKGWAQNGDSFSTRFGLPPNNFRQGGPAYAYSVTHFDNPLAPITLTGSPDWDAPEGTDALLSEGIPLARGNFKYNAAKDSVELDWPANSSETQVILEASKLTHAILDKSNTDSTYQPRTEINDSVTAHPLGGAVIGNACDLYGRVKGYQGLYVIDGALIPGATGCVAPSLTIAALAERNIERILERDIFDQ
ncbi:GMC oxidoreductase [Scytonema sp. NUACC21]